MTGLPYTIPATPPLPASPAQALALVAKAKLLLRASAVSAKGGQGAARAAVAAAGAVAMQAIATKAGNVSGLKAAINDPKAAVTALVAQRAAAPLAQTRKVIEQKVQPAMKAYQTVYQAATQGPQLVRTAQKDLNAILAALK